MQKRHAIKTQQLDHTWLDAKTCIDIKVIFLHRCLQTNMEIGGFGDIGFIVYLCLVYIPAGARELNNNFYLNYFTYCICVKYI